MAYLLMKAQLMAKMSMSSQKRLPQVNQVETVPKPVVKTTKKSAQQLANIQALKKKKVILPSAELELPKPPAGTSTARRLQDPRHSDIVRGLQEIGLNKEGKAQQF